MSVRIEGNALQSLLQHCIALVGGMEGCGGIGPHFQHMCLCMCFSSGFFLWVLPESPVSIVSEGREPTALDDHPSMQDVILRCDEAHLNFSHAPLHYFRSGCGGA